MRDDDKQEIIIVKRYSSDGDGHHGGAWKIAFADFMTAMMALFLVLWLVNAANEETKKSVASYFNPVKLVDRNRSSKGLEDAKVPASQGEDDKKVSDSGRLDSQEETADKALDDTALFKDPFQVLNQIAKKASEEIEQAEFIAEAVNNSGSPSEDAFLDPFVQAVAPIEQKETGLVHNTEPSPSMKNVGQQPNFEEQTVSKLMSPSLEKPIQIDQTVLLDKQRKAKSDELAQKLPKDEREEKDLDTKREAELKQLASEIQSEIRQSLRKILGKNELLSESLSVHQTKEGILISITDQFGISMFQVGSALPKGQLVLAMKEVSDILSKRKGKIRVFGHTDARPYGGDAYDNWRLSTARAHAARLMLGRGQVDPKRISRVVGFADRKLKEPLKPTSEVNRRIEILLEVL